MPAKKLPTEAELGILQVMWRRGPSTVRTVLHELGSEREIGYTTVLKLMQIMTSKGLLRRDTSVRPQMYSAANPRRETRAGLIRRLADGAFEGSAGDLALYALRDSEISATEREQILAVLDGMEDGR